MKLLLDVDNALPSPAADVDDALALVLALVLPKARLAGVTACAGNCSAAASARNSRALLRLAGSAGIPVAAGREAPFLEDRLAHRQFLQEKADGPDREFWKLAGDWPQPERAAHCPKPGLKAHELIIQEAKAPDGPLRLALTGSLTNLGLALLAAPEIADLLGPSVHMGGAFAGRETGFSTPDIPDSVWRDILRFNTLYDPHAAAVVLKSGLPLTIVPVNVTAKVFLRPRHIADLDAAASPLAKGILPGVRAWLDYSMRRRGLPGAHMHDPAALAALARPEWFAFAPMRVDLKRLFAGDNAFLTPEGPGPTVLTAVDVQARAVEDWIARGLKRAMKG